MGATTRPYSPADQPAIEEIYGNDEFARPKLLQKYPKYGKYMVDEMSYYSVFEPESLYVAETEGQVVGALLGAIDTERFKQLYRRHIRPRLWRRIFSGAYGWPGWLPALMRTQWAERDIKAPKVDHRTYPAHLHIGVLPTHRRQGFGTMLMDRYADYLRTCGVTGYHLYASSFHPLGIAFYNKLGLEILGQFDWRLHTGFEWINVTEIIFGKRV